MSMRAEKLLVISQFLSACPEMFDYIHDIRDNVTIPSGKITDIVRYEGMAGLLIDAKIKVTSPDILFRFTIDTDTFEVTPRAIWEESLGREERRLFRILRYDPDYKLFIGGLCPDPLYPITEKILVALSNTTDEDVVASWHIFLMKFTDKLRSLLEEVLEEEEEVEGA